MHEKEFSSSFSPPPVRIFGTLLETYAIGHELAMIRQGNPLATYTEKSFDELSEDAQRLALSMAVEICGRLGRVSKYLFVAKVCHAPKMVLQGEIAKFREYLKAGGLDLPLAKMPRQHGVPFHYFGAPEPARLLNYVTEKHAILIASHFGGSPLNFPLGLAQILYTTFLESNGMIWVKNHQDMEREQPRRDGTPGPGNNEKIYLGDEADRVFAEATAKAVKGGK